MERGLLNTVTLTERVTLEAEYTILSLTHQRTWYGQSARTGRGFIVI
jgi:hypothetical protein